MDAYFFLRFLRTLLKIFVPLAFVILPILVPVNLAYGRGASFAVGIYGANETLYSNVTGLDQLAWGNVHPRHNDRYWAHLALAVVVVGYTCYVFFDELKSYVRLRQAYLTSPQHRLRASATTVLVTGIPPKWCTFEALDGLYDVFPGGIRNIWVNRNYDELNDKVKLRTEVADQLEGAETSLIRKARKAYLKKLQAENKLSGKDKSKAEKQSQEKAAEDQGIAMANTQGVSSGNPHQAHTLDEELAETGGPSHDQNPEPKRTIIPIPMLGQGIEAFGHGIDNVGRTFMRGLKQVGKGVDERLNDTPGLVLDDRDQAGGTTHVPHHVGRGQSLYDGSGSLGGRDRPATDASNDFVIHQSSTQSPILPGSPNDFGMDGGSDNPPIDERLAKSDISQRHQQDAGEKVPKRPGFKFWNHERLEVPSPIPHGKEEDEFPLSAPSPITPGGNLQATISGKDMEEGAGMKIYDPRKVLSSRLKTLPKPVREYPVAYNKKYDPAEDGEPAWKTYLKEKDRETMRLPIFGWKWMPSLPLVGMKVDTIDHCRKELARLNVEIEQDQRDPDRFPLMNSAFVQFNHQVAAHMACQAVSHHTPNHMAPRMVEISPDDVLWDNMSVKWWESYIRTAVVVMLIVGLIIGWAFPVTFTGLLSQIEYLENYKHLTWLRNIPDGAKSIIQGILPPLLLTLLLGLLPVILRLLARGQGGPTGMSVELTVQNYYFAFLFVQVFLVVSISSGITTVLTEISQGPQNIPSILAGNLPKASNYFFSYMVLQAFSVSAAALVQLLALFKWFVLAPLLDNTARKKWTRQTNLPDVRWGTFFPVYTNLAAIGEWVQNSEQVALLNVPGLIYSIISPLIMVFNIITFSLFWLVYRYNTLYVTKFRFDTGGLLYPKAINQLFTGLYVMELCLIGLFFLVRDSDSAGRAVGTPCKGQAIIMIVVLFCTILYQFLLNKAFSPLFKFLPITLEDDAVMRDVEFAKTQQKRWNQIHNQRRGDIIEEENGEGEDIEMKTIQAGKEGGEREPNSSTSMHGAIDRSTRKKGSWVNHPRKWRSRDAVNAEKGYNAKASDSAKDIDRKLDTQEGGLLHTIRQLRRKSHNDAEAQGAGPNATAEALFAGLNDEIEDLTPEERDHLVRHAFQHEALRAKRPVIWIPRDEMGVSDDEIFRTQRFSKHIWISNEFTGLDAKCRVVYRKSPPDFSEIDLIEL